MEKMISYSELDRYEYEIEEYRPKIHKGYSKAVCRGDVFYADLNPVAGSEEGGIRPVVVIQNDTGNRYSSTLIAAVTTRTRKRRLPTHVFVKASSGGLPADSIIMLEQIRTIDKVRLGQYLGHLDDETMKRIDRAAGRSIGLRRIKRKKDKRQ